MVALLILLSKIARLHCLDTNKRIFCQCVLDSSTYRCAWENTLDAFPKADMFE